MCDFENNFFIWFLFLLSDRHFKPEYKFNIWFRNRKLRVLKNCSCLQTLLERVFNFLRVLTLLIKHWHCIPLIFSSNSSNNKNRPATMQLNNHSLFCMVYNKQININNYRPQANEDVKSLVYKSYLDKELFCTNPKLMSLIINSMLNIESKTQRYLIWNLKICLKIWKTRELSTNKDLHKAPIVKYTSHRQKIFSILGGFSHFPR